MWQTDDKYHYVFVQGVFFFMGQNYWLIYFFVRINT